MMGDGPVKVLLIDDDEDDHVLTRDLLAEIGRDRFRLDWAPRFEAGLAAIRRQAHDVYLLDYHLGEHNGVELLRQALAEGCRAPIIMLTGLGDRDVDLEAMKAGAADYLSKRSLDARLLERAIRYALERARTLEALRESEERYSLAARGANDGLWDWDLRRDEIYFSPRWKGILGFTEAEISNRPDEWLGRVHPEDLERLRADLAAHLQGLTLHFENEHRLIHRDGSFRWMLTRGVAVRDQDGKAYRLAGSQTDTTGRKVYDGLTGLPNRMLFLDRLASALTRARRHPEFLFAVLFLDLDRFKIVNDSLGHALGDQLLIEVARRLESCVRIGDTVARMGGDEFAILLEEVRDISDATRVAARIHEALSVPCGLDGREVFTSASVGIAMSATGYESAEHVLQDADTAMYRAKSLGKARSEVFDEVMRERALIRLRMESDLRRAVERGQFELLYQPIVSLGSGRVLGFEALARWRHPERGLILPEEFIPLAEETGLIVPISDQVLRAAGRQMRTWIEQLSLERSVVVSVNVSGKQLAHGDFPLRIAEALAASGLPPERLKLEITESAIVENADSAAALLHQLRDMGVGIWLDDFGTGYSSFSHLHQFPIDTLKIDSSFIGKLDQTGSKPEITRTIVMLAHSLGMEAIAEGVESAEQRDRLCELGCDSVQGFLFSPPLTPEAAGDLLAAVPVW
ncbi:MAG TPA: EAL domain-containing protein [Thermoanaerobaculia bacterium]|jgi:diguanylate cyclase (GGDEF)-like protein/PAS domain S-box-containing protein|nr:EAL domain-containing protein [Thermoanaerobaculia bacterium]